MVMSLIKTVFFFFFTFWMKNKLLAAGDSNTFQRALLWPWTQVRTKSRFCFRVVRQEWCGGNQAALYLLNATARSAQTNWEFLPWTWYVLAGGEKRQKKHCNQGTPSMTKLLEEWVIKNVILLFAEWCRCPAIGHLALKHVGEVHR